MFIYLPVVSSFCGLATLLITGKMLRMKLKLFQQLYLPSSVVGGLLGLILLQLIGLSDSAHEYVQQQWVLGWDHLAGFLINVVFSSLFLGVTIPSAKTVWVKSGPQLTYGMMLAWSQWAVALFMTGIVLIPLFDVNPLFATLVPVGFAGGHGTAAGLATAYQELGWPQGSDFGLASATYGLVTSVVFGVLCVNFAARQGWVVKSRMDSAQDAKLSIRGVYPVDKRPAAGVQTVSADSIDTLALHIGVVGFAMLLGFGVKVALVESEIPGLSALPMFPLCMAGGIVIQLGLERFNKESKLINAAVMERISGSALDFLITAAVASVNVQAVSQDILPFLIICLAGSLWHFFMLFVIARHILPNHWFERAIAEFGMSTGVIASGLVLLRMVDPESKTPVPADFAFKQLLHSPFMGGGIWTAMAVPLTHVVGVWPMFIIVLIVLAGWTATWWFYFRRTEVYLNPVCGCKLCTSVRRESMSDPSSGLTGSHTTARSAGHVPLVDMDRDSDDGDGGDASGGQSLLSSASSRFAPDTLLIDSIETDGVETPNTATDDVEEGEAGDLGEAESKASDDSPVGVGELRRRSVGDESPPAAELASD